MKSSKVIDLLNSEGAILKGTRIITNGENRYIIHDQWKNEVARYNRYDMQQFLEGFTEITDSSGRVWNWPQQNIDMRPSSGTLQSWLNDNETM